MVAAALSVAVSFGVAPARACTPAPIVYQALPPSGTVLPAARVQLVLASSSRYWSPGWDDSVAIMDGTGGPIPFSYAWVRNGCVVSFDASAGTDVVVYATAVDEMARLRPIATYTVANVPAGSAPSAPDISPEASFCDECIGGSESCCLRTSVLTTPLTVVGDGVAAAWVDADGNIAGVLPYGPASTGWTEPTDHWYVPAGQALVSLDVLGRQSPPTQWRAPVAVACGIGAEDEYEGFHCQADARGGDAHAWGGATILALAWLASRRRGLPA